jgi:sucrose-6F-phosphate phosphohydrolase
MTDLIHLCSDLDGTVIPQAAHDESPEARPRLRQLARHPKLVLTYATGRHLELIREGIRQYDLPLPSYAIGDVGSTIYEVGEDETWTCLEAWGEQIAPDWNGMHSEELAEYFEDFDELRLQESSHQNTHKLSYYADAKTDFERLAPRLRERLKKHEIQANLIWSIDEETREGLLDILPKKANKLQALRFLIDHKRFDEEKTVYSGDSGNDLAVLGSGLRSILVRNGPEEVRKSAEQSLADRGASERLYVARGGFRDMNGYYAAGVLEGLAHFFPETEGWMDGGD